MALQGAHPDLTILFDPGEEEARRRMGWRNAQEWNSDTLAFHEEVWARFRLLCNPDRTPWFRRVDSSGPIEETQAMVRKVVLEHLRTRE